MVVGYAAAAVTGSCRRHSPSASENPSATTWMSRVYGPTLDSGRTICGLITPATGSGASPTISRNSSPATTASGASMRAVRTARRILLGADPRHRDRRRGRRTGNRRGRRRSARRGGRGRGRWCRRRRRWRGRWWRRAQVRRVRGGGGAAAAPPPAAPAPLAPEPAAAPPDITDVSPVIAAPPNAGATTHDTSSVGVMPIQPNCCESNSAPAPPIAPPIAPRTMPPRPCAARTTPNPMSSTPTSTAVGAGDARRGRER